MTEGIPAEPGSVLQDRYRLNVHIAVGGMGEVWQGTDLVLDRKVAVKLLRPEHASDKDLLSRFRAEARLAGLLSHQNIAQVFDFRDAAPPDPAFLVMEYVDGPSLAGLLHDGPLDAARTMDIVAQAARGLAAAHRAGLVHRDVKPGNLLARSDGVIKVSDFGIARAEAATPVTRTGQLPGTPGYMAPERGAGAAATPASDLYSLGVVAHQCLTGRPPFEGDALAVAIAHMEREMPPLPSSVPFQVAALVAELTSKDPKSRPSSAEEVAERAERLKATLPGLNDGTAPLPAVSEPEPALAPTLPAAALTLPDEPEPGPAAGGARLPRARTWTRLSVPRAPARAVLAAVAVIALGMAGFIGWMLGARPSPPAAGPPRAPYASSQPGPSAPAGRQTPGAGVPATPAIAPSARPSASVTPTPLSSASATATPTVGPTSSPSPSPAPSSTATASAPPGPGT